MNVPLLDLKIQYQSIRTEVEKAIQGVMEQTAFAAGPYVAAFEKAFAGFCGSRYAVGVGSGTEALWMALLAMGISPGDEVITVPNTFIATAEAIVFCGARPVFVDVDERTYTMNPGLIEEAVTPRTRALIPVHLFGQTADMDPIMEIAAKHGLWVIEDACQAHGATYKGKTAGSIGHAGCFSFYPGKNLGAYGEAGAVVTDDPELAEKMRWFLDHGQRKKYHHELIGWNGRMDGLQGAVLGVKLKYLRAWNAARREKARLYGRLLAGADGLVLPREAPYGEHVYHIFAVRSGGRDRLISRLAEKGVTCGIHYPLPIHLQRAFNSLGLKKGSFPIAERCAEELISLPMYPELRPEQIEYTAGLISEYLADRREGE